MGTAGLLLIAGLFAAMGSQPLDAVISSSFGMNMQDVLSGLGLPSVLQLNTFTVIAIIVALFSCLPRKASVYVLDFAVFAPPASWAFPRSAIRALAEAYGKILPEHMDFMDKMAYRTGLSDQTAVVPAIALCGGKTGHLGIATAREEFANTCFPCVQEVLDKTGLTPADIDFVVTNSSLFNPTPSLSATIMNHFKMGKKTKGYSLGGMGCSAGVIAIDLAKDLLEVHPNSNVLVISHENISNSYYGGNEPSMLLINTLFRVNGSAVILTNKPHLARRSKYHVQRVVRTNLAADDMAFNCIMQMQDEDMHMGIRLNKDIVQVGTGALQDNMTVLGPYVLPLSEQLLFAGNFLARKLCRYLPGLKGVHSSWTKPYTPDFRKAFDHFCIHTGGRGIIDGLEKELKLTKVQVEPSRASLYRFGNTSSTSVWYELAYIETRQGVAASSKVWQLAFGSGFKFNSCILVARRAVREQHGAWAGFDAEAMWVELDAIEASARAARAAKAAAAAAAKAAPEAYSEKLEQPSSDALSDTGPVRDTARSVHPH